MKKSIICCFFLIQAIIVSAQEKALHHQFVLDGCIKGANGFAYIEYAGTKGKNKIDSCLLKNGNFHLTGFIKEPVIAFLTTEKKDLPDDDKKIVTAEGKNATLLFLEPTYMHATIERSRFKEAEINGSASQDQLASFNAKLETLTQRLKASTDSIQQLNTLAIIDKEHIKKQLSFAYQTQITNTFHQFLEEYPNSYVSAYLITCHHFNLDKLAHYYNRMSTNVKASFYGKTIQENIHKKELVAVGKKAPTFTQKDMNGKKLSLKSFRNKYVLLQFWGSWNNDSKTENQYLCKQYSRYKNKNLEIIGIAVDGQKTRKTWISAIQKDSLSWPQLNCLKMGDNPVAIKYAVETIPSNFLIDPNGRIIATDIKGEALNTEFEKIFQ